MLPFPIIDLPTLSDPLLVDIRERYQGTYTSRYGAGSGRGLYSNADWRRIQFAASRVPAGTTSILDVGVGPGAFLNYLTMSGRFATVTGIDRVDYSKFVALGDVDRRIMDVTDMAFDDGAFDVVFCMEVLEHLYPEVASVALKELRRVARRTLVVTVPFDEPEPLPKYHMQKFDAGKLSRLFPQATIELVKKPKNAGWPWALITEAQAADHAKLS